MVLITTVSLSNKLDNNFDANVLAVNFMEKSKYYFATVWVLMITFDFRSNK